MIVWWAIGVVLGAFLLIVLRGAPYVPTHRPAVAKALELLDLPQGSVVVDLGSGDGVFLKAAAERGYRAIGYELNPFLCLISYARCWRYRKQVSIRWRDFWLSPLPSGADAVFVFLAGPYLRRLHAKLVAERERQGRPFKVVSYGFVIPHAPKALRSTDALHLYQY